MRGGGPTLNSEADNYAWTVIKMGGLEARVVPFRDSFWVVFMGGGRIITANVASFVRRGYIQLVTKGNKITILFPGDPGWKELADDSTWINIGRLT